MYSKKGFDNQNLVSHF